jgi:formate hydrogenlyase transcriptional activator
MTIENDILIVDDEIPNLQLLAALLEKEGYPARPAENAQTALDSAMAKPPGLILLDVRMPGMDGFELCRRLKQDKRTQHVPVIFVSALQDTEARIQGFEAGGVDYITKPYEEPEILARVRTHLQLHQLQQYLEQTVDERTAELKASNTNLQQAIKEIKESDERYELAIAGSAAGIWDWDIHNNRVYYSDRLKKLLGYQPDEFSDSTDEFWNRLHPDDYKPTRRILEEHLKKRTEFKVDYRIRTKTGEYRWFHGRGQALWNDERAATRMSGSLIDITENKLATERLRMTEERFRGLIEQSPMPIEILSLDGKILQSNLSWRKLWGVDEAGAADTMKKYNMLTDQQIKKLGINHLVEKAFSGESIILPPIIYDANVAAEEFEIENIPRLKSPWIQCHLYPIKDLKGKIVNVVNTYVDISDQKNKEIELRGAYDEIGQLKNQLEAESAYLRDEIKLEHNFENIIGQSEALKYVLHRVEQVAPADSPVLIMGETGTGKELIARALHDLSPHGKRALVKVNCAALPGELIESELFGREKGAFTGAATTQLGRFELAKGSTLFLDEIGELPLELQAKLLRVLESGEFERLGSSRTLHSDARIIAATNRVVEEEVRKGRFREDLWYRLKVLPITVPPLREHPEDIPLLIKWFVDQLTRKMGKRVAEVSKRTMQKLQNYPWPGNVRELKHAVESALITAQGKKLNFELPETADVAISDFKTMEQMERDYLLHVLNAKNWRIGGKNSAASILGMHVNTLRGRMKKLGIKRPKPQ